MATMYCPDGEHEQTVRFKATAGERFCPKHRCALRPMPKKQKARAGRWNGDLGLQRLEAEAHAHFKRVVTTERCFFTDVVDGELRRPEHVECTYPLDPHHLVEVQWMRRELVLPPEDLIAVMYDPIIGAPLCRGAHGPVERRVVQFIYWDELRLETVEFCEAVDRRTPDGTPSMLERLRLESPERPTPDPHDKEAK